MLGTGADARTRTPDPLLTKQPLYQLSYEGKLESKAPPQRLGWTWRKSGFCICSAILPDGCQHPKLNIL